MKKTKPDDPNHPQDNSLPVYGQNSEGQKKRGFNCVLENGETYIESLGRNGHKIKTPVAAAVAAAKKLKEESSGCK